MSNGTNTNSNGEDDASVDFLKGIEGVDKISDAAMAEIARRLQIFIGGGVSGAVVTGSTPPQDKSKLWDRGDGQVYRYDTASGQWVPTTAVPNVNEFPGISDDEGNDIEERADGIYAGFEVGRIIISEQSTQLDNGLMRVDIDPGFTNQNYLCIVTPLHDIKTQSSWYEKGRGTNEIQIQFVEGADYDTSAGTSFRITLIENLLDQT